MTRSRFNYVISYTLLSGASVALMGCLGVGLLAYPHVQPRWK